jgi:hypothetical protein
MRTKAQLLADLDAIERDIGALIADAFLDGSSDEPLALKQARIRYGEGGLWLRHWIEQT